MGTERKWILLSYMSIAAMAAWVLDRALSLVAQLFRIHNPLVMGVMPASSLISLAVMGTVAFFYFRQEKVNNFSQEVVQEMKKVTWPVRKTTLASTGVVIIAVMIVSLIMWVYDSVLSLLIGKVLGL